MNCDRLFGKSPRLPCPPPSNSPSPLGHYLHTTVQVIVLSVLREWERQGLDDHLAFVRGMYARKGQAFLAAARQHLSTSAVAVPP